MIRSSSSATWLVLLAGWTVFAFGGTYRWTTIPFLLGVVWLAALEHPRPARRPFRLLDASIIACLTVVVLQLIPLPSGLRQWISPAALAFDSVMRFGAPGDPLAGPPRPLSIDPAATAWVLAMGIGLVAVFWCGRAALVRGGVRTVARGVAWLGLAVAAFAIVQHGTAPKLLYWHWRPLSPSATPYGPFVNRNDLACWLVMALPLVIGYASAHIHSLRHRDGTVALATVLDSTTVWLVGSACLMMGALLVSLSRSGITAGAVSMGALVWMSRSRVRGGRTPWLLGGILATTVAIATVYVNVGALANRVGESLAVGVGGRRAIWHDSWTMTKDFWATGVGAGAYQRGMLVYQQGSRTFYFNHAHDEYLQVLAEGGVLLSVPAGIGVLALAGSARRRLRADRSAAYWIRAGAASGMVAAAVQSVWDVGLQMPANGVLFAILAAVALHEPKSPS